MSNDINNPGKLIIISAPSGAGKTTLVKALCVADPGLMVSVSHTTRAKREGEVDGVDYFFTDTNTFQTMIDAGQFLEHAKVFDNYYGTSRDRVESQLKAGIYIILEIDWQGAARVRELMPDCVSIFILPPSVQALQARLTARGKDDTATIQRRMRDAFNEISHYDEYDFVLINDDLSHALSELQGIVAALRENRPIQQKDIRQFVDSLMAET